jgi:hypothetical protein
MNPWSVTLTGVATTTGALTQLYPAGCTAGTGATTAGTLVRRPCEGVYKSLTITPDGTNGGLFELWDMSGVTEGIDVNTATAITAAQVAAAIAANRAKLIKKVAFSGATTVQIPVSTGGPFLKGLAGRFSNAGAVGTLSVSMFVDGGAMKTEIVG